MLSDFAKWAVCVAVPWLKWPALDDPTTIDLQERIYYLAWDPADGDKELAGILTDFGAIDYLEKDLEATCKNQL